MIKTEMMKKYEQETGCNALEIVYDELLKEDVYSIPKQYGDWLEAKAEAYDRIMSGGQKTPKEIANIFGFPIAMDCYSSNHEFQHGSNWNWFTTKPFIDGENDCWTIKRGQWGRVPYGLLNGYDGEWQESLTFPDRQIGGNR